MTRRVLTALGSATAVATAVGACLLLGPTPQAQAADCGRLTTGSFKITNGCISATNNGNSAWVSFMSGMITACGQQGTATPTCKTYP